MDLSWLLFITATVVVFAALMAANSEPSKEIMKLEVELLILKKLDRMIEVINLRSRAEIDDLHEVAAKYQAEYDELEADFMRLKAEREEYMK